MLRSASMELRITPNETLTTRWRWSWTPFAAKRTPTAFLYERTSPGERCNHLRVKPACYTSQEEHTAEHRQERYYAHDIWAKSEKEPASVKALNIDAPTQDQFDIYPCKIATLGMWSTPSRLNSSGSQRLR
eukprot:3986541-Pleurochrysis_carterae.AAC.1